jgi:hypothetical protein
MEVNPALGKDRVAPQVLPLLEAVRRTPPGVYMCMPISRAQAIALLEYVRHLEEEQHAHQSAQS